MRSKLSLLIIIMVFSVIGCGGGGGDSTTSDQPDKINVLSPKDNQSIEYSYVTLEVDATNLQDATAQNSTNSSQKISGVKNDNAFYIYNVPLSEGANQVDISATKNDGSVLTQSLSLNSQAKGVAVYISMGRREGYETLLTSMTVKTSFNPSEYLLDENGDGIFDNKQTINTFSVNYNEQGQFLPIATVRTNDNLLFSSLKTRILPINIKAKPTETTLSGISDTVVDMERFDGFIYALAGISIYKIDEVALSISETIHLAYVNDPVGFCYDDDGNLYIADTGNDRVVKLLKSSGYQGDPLISSDGSFGASGSDDGQFNQPMDCMVDSSEDDEKIFVVDSGNNRIQIFDHKGVFLSKFDGSETSNGKLNNPRGIVAASNVPVIADTGNNLIRFFFQNGKEKRAFGSNNLNSPTTVNFSDKGVLITDTGNKRILITTTFGDIVKILDVSETPTAAVNYISDRDIFLVSYQNQAGIVKLSTDSDTYDSTPEKVVQNFVEAILADDKKTVENIVANENIIDRIYSDADMHNVLIEHLQKAEEYRLMSKDKQFAWISITFGETDDILTIGLVKENGQWLINQF